MAGDRRQLTADGSQQVPRRLKQLHQLLAGPECPSYSERITFNALKPCKDLVIGFTQLFELILKRLQVPRQIETCNKDPPVAADAARLAATSLLPGGRPFCASQLALPGAVRWSPNTQIDGDAQQKAPPQVSKVSYLTTSVRTFAEFYLPLKTR